MHLPILLPLATARHSSSTPASQFRQRIGVRLLSTKQGAPNAAEPIAGTVAYHERYILLHTKTPPSSFPPHVPSKLQRELQLRVKKGYGLVNFVWMAEHDTPAGTSEIAVPECENPEGEVYQLSAFIREHGRVTIPDVSSKNIEKVANTLLSLPSSSGEHWSNLAASAPIHIYVCTHGARDCRCGDTGGAVYKTLLEEVVRRRMESEVKVGSVGHVGGHKYAT
jgi:hypothetical protein